MKHFPRLLVAACLGLGFVFAGAASGAEGGYRNRDNPNQNDSGDPMYPVPYQLPKVEEITGALERIRTLLESETPTAVTDGRGGAKLTPDSPPVRAATIAAGPLNFSPLAYEMGVVHAGMMRAAQVTGDARFGAFTQRQIAFLRTWEPYFSKVEEKYHLARANPFARMLDPRALDDCGSMLAALLGAQRAQLGPLPAGVVDRWSEYIAHGQFRLADGTLARQRPQAQSLWADDFYMGVPALAEMGKTTADPHWWDDAVKNVLQMSGRLFNSEKHLYAHGWNANNPDAPQFYWGRATGWPILAMCDLLDVLPPDHPGYAPVLAQLRAALRGVGSYQSGVGLWHQLLDREDTYLETSASAMFVYGFAHAINRGWISPTTYGSIAQAGWVGLMPRINAQGQVEGTCVATTFAGDAIYYYHRPVNVDALHGYGPVLLAGSEMIELLRNPKFTIEVKLRTYHYVPKDGGPTSYREHQ